MNKIAQMSTKDRAGIFSETADRKNVADAIVEKDFWVCWVLKQLFSIETLSNRLLFKGGTSLSKVFVPLTDFPKISILRSIMRLSVSRESGTLGGTTYRKQNGRASSMK